MSSGHAILSPSSAHRWLICTPSARYEKTFPDSESSYAAEGTLAHKIAELKLSLAYTLNETSNEYYRIKDELDRLYENPMYTDAMGDHVEDYVAFVEECMAEMDNPVISLEQKYDMTEWVPEGFGTGDVTLIDSKLLWFIDLKYGMGKRVEANNNKQLMLYGLGAIRAFDYLHEVERVRMTIYQPRISNFSSFEMSVKDLLEWAEKELKPTAQKAWKGEGEFIPGDHCLFCRGAHLCKALADKNMELAKFEFLEANKLGPEEISEILDRYDVFVKWIESIYDYALDQAVNHNVKWPGYKTVEGRSIRKIMDEAEAAKRLMDQGKLDPEELYNTKLKGITDLEKAVGKKRFAEILGELVQKPPGKPTLVPESDKRPALNSSQAAAEAFAD